METIDDSGSYDVRRLREGDRVTERIIERQPKWVGAVLTVLAGLTVAAVSAAWSATGRLSAVEAQVVYMREEIAELKRLVEPRYRGGPNEPNAR
jgi:hypothetical protein